VKEDIVVVLITRKVGNTYLFSRKDKSLGLTNYNPPLKLSKDKLGSYGNSWTNNEFNNNSKLEKDNIRQSPIKRKRLSLFNNRLI
jgi:hypothetical protein